MTTTDVIRNVKGWVQNHWTAVPNIPATGIPVSQPTVRLQADRQKGHPACKTISYQQYLNVLLWTTYGTWHNLEWSLKTQPLTQ